MPLVVGSSPAASTLVICGCMSDSETKWSRFVALALRLLKNPQLNLAINIGLMIFTGLMATGQWALGNTPIATVLSVSTVSYISAILFWILIWKTGPR